MTHGTKIDNGGTGFQLQPDELKLELKRLESLRDRIFDQGKLATALWRIESPADDPISNENTDESNRSGLRYREHLQQQFNYLSTMIDRMRAALGIHQSTDAQAGRDLPSQGGGRI